MYVVKFTFRKLILNKTLLLISFANFLFFCPGKEVYGFYSLTLSLVLLYFSKNKIKKNMSQIGDADLWILIAVPLMAHIIYGAFNMFQGLIEVGIQGLFENNHLRAFISIGVKRYSLICLIALVFFLNMYIFSKKEIFFYKIIIVIIITIIGLINSLNGTLILFLILLYYVTIFYIFEKQYFKEKNLKNILIFSFFSFLIAFSFSGGMKRVLKLDDNIHALNNNLYSDDWKFKNKFNQNLSDKPKIENTDESFYLRFSWYRYGILFILNHPFGIGLSDHPLKAALHYENPDIDRTLLQDDFHSEILNIGISFGFPGLLFIVVIFAIIYRYLYRLMILANFKMACLFFALQMCFWWILFFDTVSFFLSFSMIFLSTIIIALSLLMNSSYEEKLKK